MDPPPCRQDDQYRYFLATPRMLAVRWPADRVPGWVSDSPADRVPGWVINSPAQHVPGWVSERLTC